MKDDLRKTAKYVISIFFILCIIGLISADYGNESEIVDEPKPIAVTPKPSADPHPECNQNSGIIGSVSEVLCRTVEKLQAKKRADPNNQYKSLEECLNDKREDSTLGKTREEWCDSNYVLISPLDAEENQ
jgi:hypothetical protein